MAVLNDLSPVNWKLEMEISFKMDFGAAFYNRGFRFEIRDPATAIKSLSPFSDSYRMQNLRGSSIKNILNVLDDGVEISLNWC